MSGYDAQGVRVQTHLRISTVNSQGSFQRRVGHFCKDLSRKGFDNDGAEGSGRRREEEC